MDQVIYSSPGLVQCVSSRRAQWSSRYMYLLRCSLNQGATQEMVLFVSPKPLSQPKDFPTAPCKDAYEVDVSSLVLDSDTFDVLATSQLKLPASTTAAFCVELRNPTSSVVRAYGDLVVAEGLGEPPIT
jgi:hypothetical protein